MDARMVGAPDPAVSDELAAALVLRLVPHEVGVDEHLPAVCGDRVDLADVGGAATVRLLHQYMLAGLQRVNHHRLAHIGRGGDPDRLDLVIGQQFAIVAVDPGNVVLLRDLTRQLLIQIGDRPGDSVFARLCARDPRPTDPATDHADSDGVRHHVTRGPARPSPRAP